MNLKRNFAVFAILISSLALFLVALPGSPLSSQEADALDQARDALIGDANGFIQEADRELANGWRALARDHLSDYEQGRLDELFDRALLDRWSHWNHHGLMCETRSRVQKVVERQIIDKTRQRFATEAEITAHLEQDHRARRLNAILTARFGLMGCVKNAKDAATLEGIHQIEDDLEHRKRNLVRAIKTVAS